MLNNCACIQLRYVDEKLLLTNTSTYFLTPVAVMDSLQLVGSQVDLPALPAADSLVESMVNSLPSLADPLVVDSLALLLDSLIESKVDSSSALLATVGLLALLVVSVLDDGNSSIEFLCQLL